jgi:integrase
MIDYLFKPTRRRKRQGSLPQAAMPSKFWSWRVQLPGWPKCRTIPLGVVDKRVAAIHREKRRQEFEMEAAGVVGYGSVRQAASRPISEHLRAFLEDVQGRGRRPATLKLYRKVISKLCDRCGWRSLSDVTPASFAAWRSRSGQTPKFLNDQLGTMCTFLNWMERDRLILANPLKHVGRVDNRAPREYRRAISIDDARRLVRVAPPEHSAIYILILYTGLRRIELNRIRWRDFEWHSSPPRLIVAGADTKNGKPAVFNLRPEIIHALQQVRRPHEGPDDLAFCGRVPSVRTFKRDLEAAGIAFLDGAGRRVDIHALRKTFITWGWGAGVGAAAMKALARHSDLRLTAGPYMDNSQLPLAAAVEQWPSVFMPSKDSQMSAQTTVATGEDLALSAASMPFGLDPEIAATVACTNDLALPGALCADHEMVGAVRFELTTSTSRT